MTITLIFAVFFAPQMMRTAAADVLAETISNFTGDGTGSLTATTNDATVTVMRDDTK